MQCHEGANSLATPRGGYLSTPRCGVVLFLGHFYDRSWIYGYDSSGYVINCGLMSMIFGIKSLNGIIFSLSPDLSLYFFGFPGFIGMLFRNFSEFLSGTFGFCVAQSRNMETSVTLPSRELNA